MAAGLGFKTFTTGEVLTAADTNGYLMQGVLVFASSAARAAAITSPQEGQYSYLKDTNSTEYYDGAAWIAAPIGDITGVTAGTGISGGGTSGTVTITNSMATEIAAKGDLIVGTGSATFDNLTVGTNNQILVADSAEATGLKWATPSAGNYTLISRTSFSNVASQAIDSVFSSTYKSYQIMIEDLYSTSSADDLIMQLRYAGPTTQTTTYYEQYGTLINASLATLTIGAGTEWILNTTTGISGSGTTGRVDMFGVSGVSAKPSGSFQSYCINNNVYTHGGINNDTARIYTGFLLKSASTNITGTVAVYGRN